MVERVEIGNAVLYRGDCREIAPSLEGVKAIISDPPYGMNWNPNSTRFSGGHSSASRGRGIHWDAVAGDENSFDPTPWLHYQYVVLFGCNHFASQLPVGTSLVWIKRLKFGTFLSDGEIAWMKGGHGVYCYQDASMNGAGANFPKLHPTQKPLGLMAWCMEKAKVPTDALVLDPYMGSGTTGVDCLRTGRSFVGIEIDPRHFEVACRRLEDAYRQIELFSPAATVAGMQQAELPIFATGTHS